MQRFAAQKEFVNHFSKLRALSTSQCDVLGAAASLITHCCTSYCIQFSKTCNEQSLLLSSDYVTTNVNIHILSSLLWSVASFTNLAVFS